MPVVRREISPLRVLVLGMGAEAFGLEKQTVAALRHMSTVEPHFLVSKYENGSVSSLLDRNGFDYEYAPFGYLGRSHPAWTLATLAQLPWLSVKILYYFFSWRCRSVLVLNLHPLLNAVLPIFILRRLLRVPVVAYFHNVPAGPSGRRLIASLINRLATKVVAISGAVRTGLSGLGVQPERIEVVHNGVEWLRFAVAAPGRWRDSFGVSDEVTVVGYVGQLTEQKGVWDFLLAAEELLLTDERYRFLIAGRLDRSVDFERGIAAYLDQPRLRKHFGTTGWLDAIEGVYACLDIVVVPSRHEEPFGLVNIEALATGVPVVATRVGGVPEVVVDGETGLLVDRCSPSQIAGAVSRLAKDRELRARMGQAGRQRVRRCFDITRNARQVEEVLWSPRPATAGDPG